MSEQRDPRVDPRAGDVLQRVTQRRLGSVPHRNQVRQSTELVCKFTVTLVADGEVVWAGESPQILLPWIGRESVRAFRRIFVDTAITHTAQEPTNAD